MDEAGTQRGLPKVILRTDQHGQLPRSVECRDEMFSIAASIPNPCRDVSMLSEKLPNSPHSSFYQDSSATTFRAIPFYKGELGTTPNSA